MSSNLKHNVRQQCANLIQNSLGYIKIESKKHLKPAFVLTLHKEGSYINKFDVYHVYTFVSGRLHIISRMF